MSYNCGCNNHSGTELPVGEKGNTGATGPQGPRGYRGFQGQKGADGAQGTAGVPDVDYATPTSVLAAVEPKLNSTTAAATYATLTGLSDGLAPKLNSSDAAIKYVPYWKPNTAYVIGQQVVSPNNDVVSAITGFTSGATYTGTNWVLSSTYVRFVDLAGNPITARHVTIKVDTSTWEISDIVAEA